MNEKPRPGDEPKVTEIKSRLIRAYKIILRNSFVVVEKAPGFVPHTNVLVYDEPAGQGDLKRFVSPMEWKFVEETIVRKHLKTGELEIIG